MRKLAFSCVVSLTVVACGGSPSGEDGSPDGGVDAGIAQTAQEARRALRASSLQLASVAGGTAIANPLASPAVAPVGAGLIAQPTGALADRLAAMPATASGFRSKAIERPIEPLADRSGRFVLRRNDLSAFFDGGGFALSLPAPREKGAPPTGAWNLHARLVGAKEVTPLAEAPRTGLAHRRVGPMAAWQTDVPNYGQLAWEEVYPGVDMVVETTRGGFGYRFVASPGADLSRIELAWRGAKELRVVQSGRALELETDLGTLHVDGLRAYEVVGGYRNELEARHVVHGDRSSVEVKGWTGKGPLVIDPSVWWSTYLGGSNYEEAGGIALDAGGNVLVTGSTLSTDFPTDYGYDKTSAGNTDVFLTKFSNAGALVWSTYLGTASHDYGRGVAVDSSGNAFVVGETIGTGLATVGAFDTSISGNEGFVAKLSAANGTPLWVTYVGGTLDDVARRVAVDSANSVYVVGKTKSTDFPVYNAHRATHSGGDDAFVTKLTSAGALAWSTYLGGSSIDEANAVAIDASSNVWVAGGSTSTNFDGLSRADSSADATITKFTSAGVRSWSKFFGGTSSDIAQGIAIFPSGRAVIVGWTNSADFPNTSGVARGGSIEGFATVVDSGGAIYRSTYIGGSAYDQATDVAVDSGGTYSVVGETSSSNFPNVLGLTPGTDPDNAFLVKMLESGATPTVSTVFPDPYGSIAYGVAVDASRNVFVAGATVGGMPMAPTGWDMTHGGSADAFIYVWPYYQADGAKCAAGGMCQSTQCADGVCCDSACTGACRACTAAKKGTGTDGICGFIPNGLDPDVECTPQSCSGSTVTYKQVCNGGGACRANGTGDCSPYTCNGTTACRTTCAVNTDCLMGFYCLTGACTASKANGAGCTEARECASNYCVEGVCCDGACAGGCQSCKSTRKGSGSDGTCGPIAIDTDPKNACETDYEYPTNCAADGLCDGTGACRTYAKSGTVCVTPSCASGIVSNPRTCNGSGTCSPLTTTSCNGYVCSGTGCATGCSGDSQCMSTHYCNAGSCAAKKANGVACGAGNQCVSGSCVDGVCCNVACTGTCQACTAAKKGSGSDGTCGNIADGVDPDAECAGDSCSGSTMTYQVCNGSGACRSNAVSCAPYLCNGTGTACAVTCTTDSQCGADSYCGTGSVCTPRLAQGTVCTAGNQCRVGLSCVDGFCCDRACTGACEACSAAIKGRGVNGTCEPIAADIDPKNMCAASSSYPSSCAADGMCDGSGSCRLFAKSGVQCAPAGCASGSLTSPRTCDGGGACSAATPTTSCGAYQCNGSVCGTSCTSAADCTAGNYCDGTSKCVAKKANAAACASAGECTSGNCVDGVCCNDACTGKCTACTAAKKGGGTDGTCGLIGDGRDPDAECGTVTCLAGSLGQPVCNGAGTCRSQVTACAPYACAASGTACLSTCTIETDCAATAYCTGTSTCAAKKANGATCIAKKECASGNCVDGFCCDDPCTGGCMACSAALKGSGANGACGPIAADNDPKDACVVGAGYPASCSGDGTCDGSGACRMRAKAGTVCAPAGCESGSLITSRTCDSSGMCGAATPTTSCGAYQCAGSVCATTCATDAGCKSGYFCSGSGACVAKKSNGATCATGTECGSGSCVDGFCCDTACTGKCEACSAAKKGTGANGACGPIVDGRDPDAECGVVSCVGGSLTTPVCNGTGACRAAVTSCAPYSCAASGTACLGSACTSDSECASTAYCDATLGCTPKKTNGATCTTKNQCTSNFCVDGVCCNEACTGGCVACTNALKGSGADGLCDSIRADTDPKSACAVGPGYPATCAADGMCDGTGVCRTKAKAGTECAPAGCAAGSLISARTCDSVGTCLAAVPTTSCGAYGCDGAVCATGCTTDASCSGSTYCSGGACIAKKTNGTACTAGNQCSSGQCADGVCCDAACSGKCEACTAAKKGSGADGTCGAIADGADPDEECTGDTCVSGTLTVQVCDGSRGCKGKSSSCGSFGCNTTGDACLKACASDDDCGADYYCTAAKDCAKRKLAGVACAVRNECKSGLFCADGVCCDQACNGQCQACNEKGSEGSCVAVLGAPRGTRTACKGDGSACNGACDGVNGAACAFPSASTTCGDGCKDAKLSVCDGAGTCLAPAPCAGNLACDSAKACRSTCAEDAHCISGYRCSEGKCAPKPTSTCSGDGLSSISSESGGTPQACAPYRCGPSGACLATCSTSSDCAPGNICDLSQTPGRCTAITSPPEEGGGCACSTRPARSSGGLVALLAALAALSRRRRARDGAA